MFLSSELVLSKVETLLFEESVKPFSGVFKILELSCCSTAFSLLSEVSCIKVSTLESAETSSFKVETFAAARSVISLDENLYYYRLSRPGQDVAADDERLYVHFPIFAHLNESIAGQKNQKLTDYLQLCKLQTHRYALGKIKQEFVTEYISRARDDLNSTGSFLRTSFLIKQMLGKRSMLFYWAIMMKNRFIMRTIK